MSGSKPWVTNPKCQGLQYREYAEGRTYRVKIGRYPDTYTASLGMISEVEAIRIVSELRENRATGIGFQTIAEKEIREIEIAQAQDIEQNKERRKLIADDNFAKANTVGKFWDNVYWIRRCKKGSEHNNSSLLSVFNNHVRPIVGDIALTDLKYTDVESMQNVMYAKKLSPKTVKHAYTALQAMYNYAIIYLSTHNKINLPIFAGKILDKPKLNNEKTCFLTYNEARHFLDILYNWRDICRPHKLYFKGSDTKEAYGMAILALFCGLRFGDIAELKWKDIELAYSYARNPKGGKAYGVHLDIEPVQKMIEERKTFFPNRRADDYVFLNLRGLQWAEVPQVFFDALEETCINYNTRRINNKLEKIDFHALRHTFASWLAMSGTDLHKIMLLMGHNSIQMTLRYARLDPEYTKKHVQELAENLALEK